VAASRMMSWPSTRALPPSGRSSVARMRIVVVFPVTGLGRLNYLNWVHAGT
jgi:hypothetical protein